MRTLALLLALPLLLAACGQHRPATNITPVAADDVEFGTLFDGTKLVVGKGDLAGKAIVVNFFGVG